MKLTVHKTESVYRRYAIISEADLSKGMAKLATLHQADGEGAAFVKEVPYLEKSLDKAQTK